jgi:hypothetical protein
MEATSQVTWSELPLQHAPERKEPVGAPIANRFELVVKCVDGKEPAGLINWKEIAATKLEAAAI